MGKMPRYGTKNEKNYPKIARTIEMESLTTFYIYKAKTNEQKYHDLT